MRPTERNWGVVMVLSREKVWPWELRLWAVGANGCLGLDGARGSTCRPRLKALQTDVGLCSNAPRIRFER